MKIESSDPNADADRMVTSTATIPPREATGSARPTPVVPEPEKSSKATVLVIAAIVALSLIVFLWLRWGRN